MPFHICFDEVLAVMMMFPFVGLFIASHRAKIHAWFHRRKGTPTSLKPECPHDHEHTEDK